VAGSIPALAITSVVDSSLWTNKLASMDEMVATDAGEGNTHTSSLSLASPLTPSRQKVTKICIQGYGQEAIVDRKKKDLWQKLSIWGISRLKKWRYILVYWEPQTSKSPPPLSNFISVCFLHYNAIAPLSKNISQHPRKEAKSMPRAGPCLIHAIA